MNKYRACLWFNGPRQMHYSEEIEAVDDTHANKFFTLNWKQVFDNLPVDDLADPLMDIEQKDEDGHWRTLNCSGIELPEGHPYSEAAINFVETVARLDMDAAVKDPEDSIQTVVNLIIMARKICGVSD